MHAGTCPNIYFWLMFNSLIITRFQGGGIIELVKVMLFSFNKILTASIYSFNLWRKNYFAMNLAQKFKIREETENTLNHTSQTSFVNVFSGPDEHFR